MIYRLTCLALLLSACGGNPPLEFYMLAADADSAGQVHTPAFNNKLLVGLGPIHLPEYLNRPQMVAEVTPNQYRLDEHHRWAERLDLNISRTLTQFLTVKLGVDRIAQFPWSQSQAIDYQIPIDILELNQSADGQSRLRAQWRIIGDDKTLLSRHTDCAIPAAAEAGAMVKAQSICLGRLGLEIESGLRQLAAGQ